MKKSSKKTSRLLETIYDNNLCLSKNPKGIDTNWPKSFAKLYYSQTAEKLFQRNKSPKILEVNSNNLLKEKLWRYFFINPIVILENIYNLNDYYKSKKINKESNFEMIIINNYHDIDNLFQLINILRYKLSFKGIIIIEGVYFDLSLVSKMFFFYETNIFDYRLNKFLINNCLLEVKNSNKMNNLLKTFSTLHKYLYHFIIDILYISFFKFSKFFN